MEGKVLAMSTVVGILGIISAALGFAAEAKKIKSSDVELTILGCNYPKSPALVLGFLAAVVLLVAQISVHSAAGCICCKRRPNSSSGNRSSALVASIISWITFSIALFLLLAAAALNDRGAMERRSSRTSCYVVKPGVFSAGALLSLASISLGIVYYLASQSGKHGGEPWRPPPNSGIAMGQPQIPPPVFVHEDTYNRRQNP